jgi:hypothetical protein
MGLFEDDANVRKIKVPKPVKLVAKPDAEQKQKPKAAPKPATIGDRFLEKLDEKPDMATVVSKTSQVNFGDVDLQAAARKKKTVEKAEDGKIVPPINYVSD